VLHSVNFIYRAPLAKSVSLVGDFNDWQPTAHPMTRMPDGGWIIRMELPHGHHQYLFLVDGQPTLDPNAMGKVHNGSNEVVSLIAIS
jgi:1,4-alpha-glucan branching enzyme